MHALIVVDVQAGFNVPQALIDKIQARLDAFPLRVFTQFCNKPDSLFQRKLQRSSCTPGDPGAKLVIEPRPGDLVLVKSGYGLDEEAIAKLKALGITEATIAGVDTDACVLGVMFSLWDHDIDVHIDPNLCWSSVGLHNQAVEVAHQQFGK